MPIGSCRSTVVGAADVGIQSELAVAGGAATGVVSAAAGDHAHARVGEQQEVAGASVASAVDVLHGAVGGGGVARSALQVLVGIARSALPVGVPSPAIVCLAQIGSSIQREIREASAAHTGGAIVHRAVGHGGIAESVLSTMVVGTVGALLRDEVIVAAETRSTL